MARQVIAVGFANKSGVNDKLVGRIGTIHQKLSRYRMVVRFTEPDGSSFTRVCTKWQNV